MYEQKKKVPADQWEEYCFFFLGLFSRKGGWFFNLFYQSLYHICNIGCAAGGSGIWVES